MDADASPASSPVASPSRMEAGHAASRKITRLSVGVAVVLIAMKAFALGASGSVSMLASLTDSALDLIASLVTFFAVRWAAAPPDEEHRFGHGKAEALAALVQAGLVFASAVFVGWEAISRIFDPRPVQAGSWALGVMLVSVALTGWLVWMQTRALKTADSLAVAGDRAHYAADLGGNLVVIIGVFAGAYLAAPGLDAVAGLVVCVWLAWGAFNLLRDAADNLLDKAVDEADRARIVQAVLSDTRIGGLHRLRTRKVGPVVTIQMHVDLEPELTLKDAHAVLEEAEARLLEAFPHADIMIHPDPRSRDRAAISTAVPPTR